MWEGGQERWKRLLLKSPRGNGQAGQGRAELPGTPGKGRGGHCEGEERSAQLSDRRAWLSRREQDGVTCKGRELQGWAGLDTSLATPVALHQALPDSSRQLRTILTQRAESLKLPMRLLCRETS